MTCCVCKLGGEVLYSLNISNRVSSAGIKTVVISCYEGYDEPIFFSSTYSLCSVRDGTPLNEVEAKGSQVRIHSNF